MTTCIITAIRRYCPPSEPSGYVCVIDPQEQKVLRRSIMVDPPYRDRDPNPRGGWRGAKGIALRDDQVAIANATLVLRYDPAWNLLGVVTHPCCACIHDMLYQDGILWVTSAQTDLLLGFDLAGKLIAYHYARDFLGVSEALDWHPPVLLHPDEAGSCRIDFRDPSSHEKAVYNRAHINSACVLPGGELLVSLGLVLGSKYASLLRVKTRLIKLGAWDRLVKVNRQMRTLLGLGKDMHSNLVVRPSGARSVVARITRDGTSVTSLVFPEVTAPSHSLLLLPDQTVIYLNTTQGAVVRYELHTGEILSSTKVTDGFLRGVTMLSERTLLLGSNGELITFDLPDQRVEKRMTLFEDPKDSIYDIKVLPPHYSLPPVSFSEHLESSLGYGADEIIKQGRSLQVA